MTDRRMILSLALLPLATACVPYKAAPVSPATYPAASASRQVAPGERSMPDLLAFAIEASPAVRESRANYRSAIAAAKAARVPLPGAFQLTGEYSHQDNASKPWLGAGSLDLPLDFGGRRNARVSAADLTAVQARYDYGEAMWTVRSALRHALIERLYADLSAPLAARAEAIRLDRYNKLRLRVVSGEEARPISVQAQIDLAAAQRRTRDNAGRRASADAALARALSLGPAGLAGLTVTPIGMVPQTPPALLANWRSDAAAGRRDVLRAIVDYDLAENALRQEIAGQYPALRLQGGYTYERGIVKLPFGLNLALPPVDRNRANIAAAQAKRTQAGAKLEMTQATVLGEVDRAAAALSAQRGIEQVARTQDLPNARRLVAVARAGLRAGETDRVDEEAASAAAIEAELALLDAERLLWMAVADLEDALRRPFDPREAPVLEQAMARLGETQ